MASNKENVQSSRAPASSLDFRMSTAFPPLPPLPPSDVSELPQSTGQAPPPPAWQPRQFGARVPGNNQARTPDNLAAFRSISSTATETKKPAQRYSGHYRESFPRHWTQNSQLNAEEKNPQDNEEDVDTNKHFTGAGNFEPLEAFPTLSLVNPPPPRPSPQKSSTQPECSIWSITPEELSAEVAIKKQKTPEPVRKHSYAEASKRNLLGLDGRQAAQKPEAQKVEQPPTRTFKKYYGLPIIPLSRLPPCDFNTLDEKEVPASAQTREEEPFSIQDCGRSFGFSHNTPTFYPRQTTDTTELLQMLETSLEPKKIAPHMDWWPGDWKCTNCGNHNFSYRDTCKRCRVGRLEDAGFVFPTDSSIE